MGKILFFGAMALFLFSCKEGNTGADKVETQEVVFNLKSLPKKATINPEAKVVLKDWVEFNALESSFDALYKVQDKEGLTLVVEDLIEKQKLLETSSFPEEFDVPQIKSRLKVIKTTILKTKFSLEYGVDTKEPATALAKAYNAFRNQFTVIVNSRLDTTLILNE
ncbi:hypothetical protein [Sediminicola sp. 1XM1-17]|uniref:hypothetical protein n=1 Tax=Sediminicola sp. 1XM1-17 TaxID=3127702 RepID=UPI003077F9AA